MSPMRSWMQAAGIVTLASCLAPGCGTAPNPPAEGLSQTSDSSPTSTDTKALSNWRKYPALSLRSAWQNFSKSALELGVGLDWIGFGPEVQALSYVRFVTDGSVELVKHIATAESKIFKDDRGTIAVSDDEPVSARCEYESEALFMVEGGASFRVGGVQVEHNRGETKILEVATTGNTFTVPDGATLASLEALCRKDFETVMRPIVERDLTAGLKSKLRIEAFDDSRLNALRRVLRDEEATVEHQGLSWIAEPVSVDAEDQSVAVRGRVRQRDGWSSQAYDFQFAFDRQSRRMTKIEIAPRGLDQVSQAAMDLSAFIARHAAEKHFAQEEGRPFVIDPKPLKKPT